MHEVDQREDVGIALGDQDENDNTDSNDQSTADGTANEKSTSDEPHAQEDTGAEDSACGMLASTTSSTDQSQGQGKRARLLTNGFAVALAGHWRVAELQFEDTARRVRSEQLVYSHRLCSHSTTSSDWFVIHFSRADFRHEQI